MSSFGHIAVGLALGRWAGREDSLGRRAAKMGALAALAMLPDADVLAFALGIPYAAPWGHRGATHSLVFAAGVALAVAGGAWLLRGRALRAGVLAFLAVGSHGPLDAMTTGGLGAALLWPFSTARYFFPLRPIPVAPIGLGMLSARGVYVVGVEVLLFLPFWAYAFWPRRGLGAPTVR